MFKDDVRLIFIYLLCLSSFRNAGVGRSTFIMRVYKLVPSVSVWQDKYSVLLKNNQKK